MPEAARAVRCDRTSSVRGAARARATGVWLLAVVAVGCTSTSDPGETSDPEEVAESEDGWATVVIEDGQTGPFELVAPDESVVWQVGTPLEPLRALADGSDWWTFWEPRLAPLTPEVANIRAVLVVTDGDELHSAQVTVTPYDLDVEPSDATGVGDAFSLVFEAQGNDVRTVEVVDNAGSEVDEVAQIVQRIDPEVLARDVWQRFVPAPGAGALWSVQCDGPMDADLESFCPPLLDGFRVPAHPPDA